MGSPPPVQQSGVGTSKVQLTYLWLPTLCTLFFFLILNCKKEELILQLSASFLPLCECALVEPGGILSSGQPVTTVGRGSRGGRGLPRGWLHLVFLEIPPASLWQGGFPFPPSPLPASGSLCMKRKPQTPGAWQRLKAKPGLLLPLPAACHCHHLQAGGLRGCMPPHISPSHFLPPFFLLNRTDYF